MVNALRGLEERMGKLFTDSIWEILKLCWKHQPHDRISAKAVLLGLEGNPSTSRPSSTADGVVETDKDNQSSTGMFSPFLPKLVVSHPCAVIGPPIAHGDSGLPARSQTSNPKEGRTGDGLLWSAWETFGAATRMLYGPKHPNLWKTIEKNLAPEVITTFPNVGI
jgi:hypothetical protein